VLQVENHTPFEPGLFLLPNERGIETLYVVVKATFDIVGHALRVAEQQRPIVFADEALGEPGQSSLKYASELHLIKPATDVVLVGSAHAPHGRPVTQCGVSLRVGAMVKVIQVLGDRVWRTGLAGQGMSAPQPFLEMPLVYERAFGGVHDRGDGKALYEPKNPVGRGFRGERSAGEMEGLPLPNLEDPQALIRDPDDTPRPMGVGPIAPSWEPRRSFAGTYDEAWKASRAPYLPLDFSPRFFNYASPELTARGYLRGGEPVEIGNCSPGGMERFTLPVCAIDVAVDLDGLIVRPELVLETVLLEPGDLRVCLTYRCAVACDKKGLKIRAVHLQLTSLATGEHAR
jgi:hypothetical protein